VLKSIEMKEERPEIIGGLVENYWASMKASRTARGAEGIMINSEKYGHLGSIKFTYWGALS
jgi:hypothetical protein